MNVKVNNISWLMWLFTTLFFGFQFILRIVPGLVINDLMAKFSVTASGYGYFSAIYYLGYAGMQIPVAYMLDRFGPRKIVFLCSFICSISSLTIAYSDNWYIALIGRFFVGVGSAAGFLGVAKVLSMYFHNNYAKMLGLTFSFGLLGAVFGSAPISMLMDIYGWRNTVEFVGFTGLLISIFILIFTRSSKSYIYESEENILKKLKVILTNKYVIWLSLSNLLLVGTLEGFADVWGIPYLVQAYGFSKTKASSITMTIYIGMLFGGPILAFFADRYKAYFQMVAIAGGVMAFTLFSIIMLNGFIPFEVLIALMFIIGICCCYQVLILSLGSMIISKSYANITVAFLNSINMFGGTFFHSAIGNILTIFWDGTIIDGVNVYNSKTYDIAIAVIPIAGLIGCVINIWLAKKVAINHSKSN
jgi:MFS family permease